MNQQTSIRIEPGIWQFKVSAKAEYIKIVATWTRTFKQHNVTRHEVVNLCVDLSAFFERQGYKAEADEGLAIASFIADKATRREFRSICAQFRDWTIGK